MNINCFILNNILLNRLSIILLMWIPIVRISYLTHILFLICIQSITVFMKRMSFKRLCVRIINNDRPLFQGNIFKSSNQKMFRTIEIKLSIYFAFFQEKCQKTSTLIWNSSIHVFNLFARMNKISFSWTHKIKGLYEIEKSNAMRPNAPTKTIVSKTWM